MHVDMKLVNGATESFLPKQGSTHAAAYDLRAHLPDGPITIYGNETTRVGTGVALDMHQNDYCAVILPRSGLGSKGLVLGNLVGLIDPDYQGELIVTLWNRTEVPIRIESGERIAQLMFLPVMHPTFAIVDEFAVSTERGSQGFGHTGVK